MGPLHRPIGRARHIGDVEPDYAALADKIQRETGIPYLLFGGRLAQTPEILRRLGPLLGDAAAGQRLADYAAGDLKATLESRLPKFDEIVFHEKLTAGQLLGAATVIAGAMVVGRHAQAASASGGGSSKGWLLASVGAAVGFAQDPDADRLAIVDETGRYIGEELTLALAASHRLEQQAGPVVLNLSTSRVTALVTSRMVRSPVTR